MKINSLQIVMILCFLLVFSSCIPLKKIEGHWQGTGDQIDGKSWQINLDADLAEGIIVTYPSLGCGGSWALIRKNKDQLWFKEQLNYGKRLCDQGVEILPYFSVCSNNGPNTTRPGRKHKCCVIVRVFGPTNKRFKILTPCTSKE